MALKLDEITGPAPYYTNTFLLTEEEKKEAMVIDPAGAAEQYLALLKKAGCTLKYIFLTHCHDDHTASAAPLAAATGAPVCAFAEDGALFGVSVDLPLQNAQQLTLGGHTLEVIHTPGHTPGSCCLRCEGVLFTGDTLFCGSVGRTDLAGGDWPTLRESLKKLCEMPLPNLQVLPGHGAFTTLYAEKKENGYLRF